MLMPSIFGRDLFEDFFDEPFFRGKNLEKMEKELYGKKSSLMKTDVKENEKEYKLEMDLPGFQKEDIKVSLENGYLTISASHTSEQEEKDEESGKYIRRERYSGACQRSFFVGDNITEEDIKGSFKHGTLKLTIPKMEVKPAVEEKKYISIEG